jgi:hypothetical protein
MSDIGELKAFALRHAALQGVSGRECSGIFSRIRDDDRGLPGSWVWEWRRAAEAHERDGRLALAFTHYNMARFPYVNGPAREYALERCRSVFSRRPVNSGIQRVDVPIAGTLVRGWASGLSATDRKPLMLIVGGLMSIKESWVPLLATARRLGMAGVVMEVPGAGENMLQLDESSGQLLSATLDVLNPCAQVAETYAVAFGFGGHLALRCAAADTRIRGIVTASVPVSDFFTGAAPGKYSVVRDALAHSAQARTDAGGQLSQLAMTPGILEAIRIPVHYLVNPRAEAAARGDVSALAAHLERLAVIGSEAAFRPPARGDRTCTWAARAIRRVRAGRRAPGARAGLAWGMAQADRL